MAKHAKGVWQAAPLTGKVEKILSRPARTFPQWAAEPADDLRN